jgi:hypothetical protein
MNPNICTENFIQNLSNLVYIDSPHFILDVFEKYSSHHRTRKNDSVSLLFQEDAVRQLVDEGALVWVNRGYNGTRDQCSHLSVYLVARSVG